VLRLKAPSATRLASDSSDHRMGASCGEPSRRIPSDCGDFRLFEFKLSSASSAAGQNRKWPRLHRSLSVRVDWGRGRRNIGAARSPIGPGKRSRLKRLKNGLGSDIALAPDIVPGWMLERNGSGGIVNLTIFENMRLSAWTRNSPRGSKQGGRRDQQPAAGDRTKRRGRSAKI
jgi:hypothetical protein